MVGIKTVLICVGFPIWFPLVSLLKRSECILAVGVAEILNEMGCNQYGSTVFGV